MVASPAKGWKTAADYVKAAKAAPGKLTYATAGTGSGTHMNAERFKLAAGIDTVHVPYKGTPEALGDTMNGRTDIYFCPVIAALPMITRQVASWRWPTAAPSAPRCCPTCRPRRNRASRTAATTSGSACSRRPARRRR